MDARPSREDADCKAFGRALSQATKGPGRRALWNTIAVLVGFTAFVAAAAVTGIFRLLPGNWAFAVIWAGLVAIVLPLNVAFDYLYMIRPLKPVRELMAFAISSGRRNWSLLDGTPEIALDPETMLRRIGDRDDSASLFIRVSATRLRGDTAGARALLEKWKPADAIAIARKARCFEQLEYAETGTDEIDEVITKAEAIPDRPTRNAQLVQLAIQKACRKAGRGEPFLDDLVAARASLGELQYPYLRLRESPHLATFLCGFAIAAGVLLTIAVAVALSPSPSLT